LPICLADRATRRTVSREMPMICGLSRCPLPEISTGEAPGKPWERVRGRASGRFWPSDQLGPPFGPWVTHQCAAGPAHQCLAASWKAPSPPSTRTRKRRLFAPRPSLIACQIRATRLVGVELRHRRSEEADVSVGQPYAHHDAASTSLSGSVIAGSLSVLTTAPRCAHAASCCGTNMVGDRTLQDAHRYGGSLRPIVQSG
jgi:hypothetical protein